MSEDQLRGLIGIRNPEISVLPVSVKMEIDMLEFSPEEREAYLSSYGIKENPTDILIRTCYDALGLQYYFTA